MVQATGNLNVSVEPRQRRAYDVVSLSTIYIFLLMAIPSRYVFGPLGGAGAPSNVLGVVFFVIYLLRWCHSSSAVGSFRQPLKSALYGTYCAFLAAYLSGALYKMPALERNGADRGIIIISAWAGVMLLIADGIEDWSRFKILIDRIVAGATAMASLGTVQFFTGLDIAKYIIIPGLTANQPYTDIAVRGSFNRPSATAIHPIEFGFVLAVILPFAIHRARHASGRAQRYRRWAQVALIAMALPMTVSRSAILGLLIALVVMVPTWPSRERWIALGVSVIGVLGLQVMIPGMVRSLTDLFSAIGSDSSTLSRTGAFSSAGPLISQHPLFGVGFGTFMPNILFYTDDQYLNSAIEVGLAGVASIIILFVTGIFTARRIRRTSGELEVRDLGQCMVASCAIVLVGFATFDAFYFPMAAGIIFLLLGCVAAAWRLSSRSDSMLSGTQELSGRQQSGRQRLLLDRAQ